MIAAWLVASPGGMLNVFAVGSSHWATWLSMSAVHVVCIFHHVRDLTACAGGSSSP